MEIWNKVKRWFEPKPCSFQLENGLTCNKIKCNEHKHLQCDHCLRRATKQVRVVVSEILNRDRVYTFCENPLCFYKQLLSERVFVTGMDGRYIVDRTEEIFQHAVIHLTRQQLNTLVSYYERSTKLKVMSMKKIHPNMTEAIETQKTVYVKVYQTLVEAYIS